MLRTLSFIAKHPLTRSNPLAGFVRFAEWQIRARLQQEVEVPWIGGSKLIVTKGMTGATGNIYCGLHEFADMAFLLHLLRPGDLFLDIGANVGSYTILASAVVGAQTIAAEPDPYTMLALRRNIAINQIDNRVTAVESAIGDAPGIINFTSGLDTMNHIAAGSDRNTREVEVKTLDELTKDKDPVFIKLDVEGFEEGVISGASETLSNPSLVAVATENGSEAVIGPLKAAGFTQFFYDPFHRVVTKAPIHAQSNALFVRNMEFVQRRLRESPAYLVLGVTL